MSGLKLECGNCGYDWDYTGESEYWATCPRCKSSVKVESEDVRVKSDE